MQPTSQSFSNPGDGPGFASEAPRISAQPEFRRLRSSYRTVAATATLLSTGTFLLYVVLSFFASGVMNVQLFGDVTLGLALGVLQFAVMALAAWRYVAHMSSRVDPMVDQYRDAADAARQAQAAGTARGRSGRHAAATDMWRSGS
jgi:uncharacterized membrane protein (DUF485 family)